PQLAFFEQLGSAGVAAYEDLVERARRLGLLVLADAKRADIGTTSEAYARAFLGGGSVEGAEISPPAADAMTVQPYMGSDSLEPFVEACDRRAVGVFVLVKTSNPGSAELQELRCGERRVCDHVAEMVARLGRTRVGASGYSPVGAVVGATHPSDLAPLRAAMPHAVLLLPGYGAQGAKADDVVGAFDARAGGALVVAARSVNFAYRRSDGAEDRDWEGSIERAARDMNASVAAALERAGKPLR
ncbi:MAG TPA: orotidine-5'-phosphate decarboxylase, partial [Planctomycetota bacterium]|nr:orotidine-5'-phosphate decarboxylase [Planctomycetota bacterium]